MSFDEGQPDSPDAIIDDVDYVGGNDDDLDDDEGDELSEVE